MIIADDVRVDLDGRTVLDRIDLEVRDGEVLVLVGPNGAGKSTLLAVLSGERVPERGQVAIDGRPIGEYSATELARSRAVFTQENAVSFPFRVAEVVAMGRAPWARTVNSRQDVAIVAESMAAADIADLSGRRMTALSGGEKARVALARVLAQRARNVLLDEPTAALDLRHEEEVMRLAQGIAAEGRAVCVVLHDLALAAAYADRMALIAHGGLAASGTPAEVLTESQVASAYGLEVRVVDIEGVPIVVPLRSERG